jgi:hypothetical protein
MPIILVGDSIADLERRLQELKQAGLGTTVAALDATDETERKVKRLKQRATKTTGRVWDLVVAAAELPAGEFTLVDIASKMSELEAQTVSPGDVKAWHRNLGKPCRRLDLKINKKVVGTSSPTRFTMSDEIRQAIRNS